MKTFISKYKYELIFRYFELTIHFHRNFSIKLRGIISGIRLLEIYEEMAKNLDRYLHDKGLILI